MKSYLSFAFKELKTQKVMAVLIFIFVINSINIATAFGDIMGVF